MKDIKKPYKASFRSNLTAFFVIGFALICLFGSIYAIVIGPFETKRLNHEVTAQIKALCPEATNVTVNRFLSKSFPYPGTIKYVSWTMPDNKILNWSPKSYQEAPTAENTGCNFYK